MVAFGLWRALTGGSSTSATIQEEYKKNDPRMNRSQVEHRMTIGWVVSGERRHAGRQGKLVPCGHACTQPASEGTSYYILVLESRGSNTALMRAHVVNVYLMFLSPASGVRTRKQKNARMI